MSWMITRRYTIYGSALKDLCESAPSASSAFQLILNEIHGFGKSISIFLSSIISIIIHLNFQEALSYLAKEKENVGMI